MKAASLNEIKKELSYLDLKKVQELCMRLAKYKKENKELLTYQLFEAQDEQGYIRSIYAALDLLFAEVNTKSLYIAKKNLRKIVRTAARYIRYSNETSTEADVLIYVCREIKKLSSTESF